jgi:uncharacterized protein YbjT (DUF2867 family)
MVIGRDRILVTGGGTFIGNQITGALLAEGANVRVLVRPGAEPLLGHLKDEVDWRFGNVWNPASLKGSARGARMVIHTIGSMTAQPEQGLTYNYLNFLSLRNVANMCVTDGVPHVLLISAASAPWIPRQYIRAKREAENFIARLGLQGTVVRAPLLYQRGQARPFVFRVVSVLAAVTPFGGRSTPMPVDIFARGVARLAMDDDRDRVIYYARDLRRLNTREERRGTPFVAREPVIEEPPFHEADTKPNAPVHADNG